MNSFSKIIALLIAVLLLFLVPIFYFAQKQDAVIQNYVMTETASFMDTIRNNGYVTKEMYNSFLKKLDATNLLYKIQMERVHPMVNPVYEEQTGTFMNDVTTHYQKSYSEDMRKEIYEGKGIYQFQQGDYISVKIVNRTKTYATRLQQMLYAHEMPTIQIYVTYGGIIRDENY